MPNIDTAVAAVIAAYCTSFIALFVIGIVIAIRTIIKLYSHQQRLFASYKKED